MKLTFSLTGDPQKVFEFLSEPECFVTVHPIIYKMEPLGGDRYKVFEKIKLGFFRYAFTYVANVHSDSELRRVVISAFVKKHTSIEMLFIVKPGNHGTVVEEVVTIISPLPIRQFMEKFIRRQHNKMFENMDELQRRV